MNDLNELRNEIYDDAVKHGLWEFRENCAWLDELDEMTEEDKKDYCVDVIVDEIDELRQAVGEDEEHFVEELADVIITALSAAGYLGIDIDKTVRAKMEINRGREWRHGK